MVKTLTIRDEVYRELTKVKKKGESFSELFLELLEKRKATGSELGRFAGILSEREYKEAKRITESLRKRLSRDMQERVS